jgi:hypothetical protein
MTPLYEVSHSSIKTTSLTVIILDGQIELVGAAVIVVRSVCVAVAVAVAVCIFVSVAV